MNSGLEAVVGVACGVLVPVVRACQWVTQPVNRLSRLVMLRANVDGVIPATTQFDGPVHAVQRPRLTLGRSCRLGRGLHVETGAEGIIRVGNHVRMSAGVHIVAYSSVTIGDDCLVGEFSSIRDANHGMAAGTRYRIQSHTSKPIVIGSNVWIGRGSVVLAGVTIGADTVVAANSVVTRDLPAGVLAAGAPAKVIRSLKTPTLGDGGERAP